MIELLFFDMPVKHRVPEVLNDKCRHFFEARWPDESPLEINAYKLKILTGLGQGTCLKLMRDEFYVPNEKVMSCLCEVFHLQPGDFLYHELALSSSEKLLPNEKPLFTNPVL
jgi:hypothetical protein